MGLEVCPCCFCDTFERVIPLVEETWLWHVSAHYHGQHFTHKFVRPRYRPSTRAHPFAPPSLPQAVKSPATSFATSLLFLTGACVNFLFLTLIGWLGVWAFMLFALVAAAGAAFVGVCLPETAGRTLLEVQALLQPAQQQQSGGQSGGGDGGPAWLQGAFWQRWGRRYVGGGVGCGVDGHSDEGEDDDDKDGLAGKGQLAARDHLTQALGSSAGYSGGYRGGSADYAFAAPAGGDLPPPFAPFSPLAAPGLQDESPRRRRPRFFRDARHGQPAAALQQQAVGSPRLQQLSQPGAAGSPRSSLPSGSLGVLGLPVGVPLAAGRPRAGSGSSSGLSGSGLLDVPFGIDIAPERAPLRGSSRDR